jgi:hypothetical protein
VGVGYLSATDVVLLLKLGNGVGVGVGYLSATEVVLFIKLGKNEVFDLPHGN